MTTIKNNHRVDDDESNCWREPSVAGPRRVGGGNSPSLPSSRQPPACSSTSPSTLSRPTLDSRSASTADIPLASPVPSFFSRARASSSSSTRSFSLASLFPPSVVPGSPRSKFSSSDNTSSGPSSHSRREPPRVNIGSNSATIPTDMERGGSSSRSSPSLTSPSPARSTSHSSPPTSSLVVKGRKSWNRLRRGSSSHNVLLSSEDSQPHPTPSSPASPPRTSSFPSHAQRKSIGFPLHRRHPTDTGPVAMVPLAPEAPPHPSPSVPLPSHSPNLSLVSGAGEGLKRKGSRLFLSLRKSSTPGPGDIPQSISPSVPKTIAGGLSRTRSSGGIGVDKDEAQGRQRPKDMAAAAVDATVGDDGESFVLIRDSMYDDHEPDADARIGMPTNVQHTLHVDSDDLACLPPAWVEELKVNPPPPTLFPHTSRFSVRL